MFEKIVADILGSVLGPYIEGLNAETLKLAVWSGNIQFSNLKVKKEVLDPLGVPFAIKAGMIGTLEMNFPWRNFLSGSTVLRLSDLCVLLVPSKAHMHWNQENEEIKAQKTKQKLLKAHEKAKKEFPIRATEVDANQTPSRVNQIVGKVIENLHVFIDNIHIRVETEDFDFGFTLKNFGVATQRFDDTDATIPKLVSFSDVSMYWNETGNPIEFSTDEQFLRIMTDLVRPSKNQNPLNYILSPIGGSVLVQLLKESHRGLNLPQLLANILPEAIELSMNAQQLKQIAGLLSYMNRFMTRFKYRMYKPFGSSPKDNPVGYWKFALKATLGAVRSSRSKMITFADLDRRREQRLEYIQLWKLKLHTTKTPERLKELEKDLTYDDIVYFRALAEAQLPQSITNKSAVGSWISWGSSWLFNQDLPEDEGENFTADSRSKVFSAINYQADSDTSFTNSTNVGGSAKVEIFAHIPEIKIHLSSWRGIEQPIVSIQINDIQAECYLRKNEVIDVEFGITSWEICDRICDATEYPCLGRSKNQHGEKFLVLSLSHTPGNFDQDLSVDVRVSDSVLTVNHEWLIRTITLLDPPKIKSLPIIETKPKVPMLSRMRAKELARAHQRHRISGSIKLPEIELIADLYHKQSTRLVLDLGVCSIETIFPDSRELNEANWADQLYDRFRINLSQIHVYILSLPGVDNVIESPSQPIIERQQTIDEFLAEPEMDEELPFDYQEKELELKSYIIQNFQVEIYHASLICQATETFPKLRVSVFCKPLQIEIRFSDICRIYDIVRGVMGTLEKYPFKPPVLSNSPAFSVPPPVVKTDNKPRKNIQFFDVHVSFSRIALSLNDNRTQLSDSGMGLTELVISQIDVQAIAHTKYTTVTAVVKKISLLDIFDSQEPIFESESTQDFLGIAFQDVQHDSEHFKNLSSDIDVQIAKILLRVYPSPLIRVASMAKAIENYTKYFPLPLPKTKQPQTTLQEDLEEISQADPNSEPSPFCKVHAKVAFAGASLDIMREGLSICSANLDPISVEVKQYDAHLEATVLLGKLLVAEDSSELNAIILETHDRFILVQFKHYQKNFTNFPGWSNELRMEVSPVKIRVVPRFITPLQAYVQEIILHLAALPSVSEEELPIILQTPTLGVKTSEAQVENPSPFNVEPIKLDIHLSSVSVIIPQNSYSENHLLLKSGDLDISSHLIRKQQDHTLGLRVRVHLDDSGVILVVSDQSIPMCAPISWSTDVDLIISDPSNSLPQISIKSELSPVKFYLAEKHYAQVVNILAQQFQELTYRVNRIYLTPVESNPQSHTKPSVPSGTTSPANSLKIPFKLVAEFSCKSISIEFLEPNEQNQFQPHLIGRVENIQAKLSLPYDKILFQASLETMEFFEPSEKDPHMYILKNGNPAGEFPQFIVSGSLSSPNFGDISVLLRDVYFFSLTEQLAYLARFFQSVQYLQPKLPDEFFEYEHHLSYTSFLDSVTRIQSISKANLCQKPKKSRKKKLKKSTPPSSKIRTWKELLAMDSKFSVNIMLENLRGHFPVGSNSSSGMGIGFKCNAHLFLARLEPVTGIQVYISDTGLYSLNLSNLDNLTYIIKPLQSVVRISDSTSKLGIRARVQPMKVVVSIQDIKLAMVIVHNYFTAGFYQKDSPLFSLQNPNPPRVPVSSTKSLQSSKPGTKSVSGKITGGLEISVIDDLFGRNIPVVNFQLSNIITDVRAGNTPAKLQLSVQVQSEFYNRQKSNWEPFIEAWNPKITVETLSGRSTSTQILMQVEDNINLTITQNMILTMHKALPGWILYYSDISQIQYASQPNEVILENLSGLGFSFSHRNSGEKGYVSKDDLPRKFSPSIIVDVQREMEFSQFDIHTIDVEFDDYQPLQHLPVRRLGHWTLELVPRNSQLPRLYVEWAVRLTKTHKRIVSVRSYTKIKNTTSLDLQVKIETFGFKQTLEAGNTLFIPVPLIDNLSEIQVRPKSQKAVWSQLSSSGIFRRRTNTRILECPNKSNTQQWYFTLTQTTNKKSGRRVINLSASVTVENLLFTSLSFTVLNRSEEGAPKFTRVLDQGEKCELFCVSSASEIPISVSIPGFNVTEGVLKPSKREFLLKNDQNTEDPHEIIVLCNGMYSQSNTLEYALFTSHWILNKTPLDLRFIPSSFFHTVQFVLPSSKHSSVTPRMFSFRSTLRHDTKLQRHYMQLQLANAESSPKSNRFNIDILGTDQVITLYDQNLAIDLGITIILLTGKFYRTKLLTIRPRYVLINLSNEHQRLFYRQYGRPEVYPLEYNQPITQVWLNDLNPRQLCLNQGGISDSDWCSPIPLDQINSYEVLINENLSVHIETQYKEGRFLMLIKSHPETHQARYLIENCTKEKLYFYQVKSTHLQELAPYSQVPYYSDDPAKPRQEVWIEIPLFGYKQLFNLDSIKTYPTKTYSAKNKSTKTTHTIQLGANLTVRDGSKLLRIIDTDLHPVLEKPLQSSWMSKLQYISLQVCLDIQGIGVSLVSDEPSELLYISIQQLYLHFASSIEFDTIEARFYHMQIDNQLKGAAFPVVFSPIFNPGPQSLNDVQDFFHLALIKSNNHSGLYLEYFSFLLGEFTLKLDDTLISHLIQFAAIPEKASFLIPNWNSLQTPLLDELAASTRDYLNEQAKAMIYIHLLHINPIKCNLTFHYTGQALSTKYSNMLINLFSAMGIYMANIDRAPLVLNALVVENSYNSPEVLVMFIGKHYLRQIAMQTYKIFGSFEIIGNPVNLISHLGTGVKDFFHEPIRGFVTSPSEFISGIGRGSQSLVRNSIVGVVGSGSSLTETVSLAISQLSLDSDYIASRSERNRRVPESISQGVLWGGKELLQGFASGYGGIVTSPIVGFQHGGVVGLLKGVSTGILGSVVKPGIGLFDFATRTTQGIKNSIIGSGVVVPVRYRRGFGNGGIVVPYSLDKAWGQFVLDTIVDGKYSAEHHLLHTLLHKNHLVLVSNAHLFFLDLNSGNLLWNIPISLIEDCFSEGEIIRIRLESHHHLATSDLDFVDCKLHDDTISLRCDSYLASIFSEHLSLVKRVSSARSYVQ